MPCNTQKKNNKSNEKGVRKQRGKRFAVGRRSLRTLRQLVRVSHIDDRQQQLVLSNVESIVAVQSLLLAHLNLRGGDVVIAACIAVQTERGERDRDTEKAKQRGMRKQYSSARGGCVRVIRT